SGSAFATSAEPTTPPPPARFSITIDWPSSAARRSNTSRGTTSAALPAPNGMVALISRDGQVSACTVEAAKRLDRMQTARRDLYIKNSGSIVLRIARTVPVSAIFRSGDRRCDSYTPGISTQSLRREYELTLHRHPPGLEATGCEVNPLWASDCRQHSHQKANVGQEPRPSEARGCHTYRPDDAKT